MTIFACDSSGRAASAALVRDGEVISERFSDAGRTHSETLMPLCAEVFGEAGLGPCDVDCFAVSAGPGSFTGLRIGVGAVKGMAFAAGAQCVAAPTLEAYAYMRTDFCGVVVPVCDARRGRVYCAAFDVRGGAVRRISPDAVREASALDPLFGGEDILFVGDSAQLCYNIYRRRGMEFDGALLRASAVARCAEACLARGEAVSANDLRPFYLQLSQAERQLNMKRRQQL